MGIKFCRGCSSYVLDARPWLYQDGYKCKECRKDARGLDDLRDEQ